MEHNCEYADLKDFEDQRIRIQDVQKVLSGKYLQCIEHYDEKQREENKKQLFKIYNETTSSPQPMQINDLLFVNNTLKDVTDYVKTKFENKEHFILHIDGAAGTGKSFLIRKLCDFFKDEKIKFALTASTGAAARSLSTNELQVSTVHLWSQYPFSNKVTKDFDEDVLVIDEISMIGGDFLSQLSCRMQSKGEENRLLFGGVSVILVGDFGQLLPVNDIPLFMSQFWHKSMIPTMRHFILTDSKRFDNAQFFSFLQNCRNGALNECHRSSFFSRFRGGWNLIIGKSDQKDNWYFNINDLPVILTGTNEKRKEYNEICLKFYQRNVQPAQAISFLLQVEIVTQKEK